MGEHVDVYVSPLFMGVSPSLGRLHSQAGVALTHPPSSRATATPVPCHLLSFYLLISGSDSHRLWELGVALAAVAGDAG